MKCLVTGGGGFVGRAVAECLLRSGHEVTVASRQLYPEIVAAGAKSVAMDLGDAGQVSSAIAGHDSVFHVAALTGVWGARSDFYRVNVEGTRHVLAACEERGVERLIYTSSPSVCFDGHDHRNASNDLPHARRFLSPYPETKAMAEAEVLAANGRGGTATCALRPHLVVGPRDPHLVPRLLSKARAGHLLRVGAGNNEVSLTYIDNAARAHRDAAERLQPDAPHAGRAYFIAQEEPVLLWPWIDEILVSLGMRPIQRSVSRRTAVAVGTLCELAWRLLRKVDEPPMTRFVAAQLASSHSYDLEPARRDFGYREVVALDEATQRVVAWFRGRF